MEFEKLQTIIADILGVNADEITKGMSFADDLGADSLEMYQIIMGIEEVFDVIIEEEQASRITTVEELLELIIQ